MERYIASFSGMVRRCLAAGNGSCTRRRRHGTWCSERGFGLIELLIAIAIIGLISAGIVTSVYQLLTASRQANEQQYVTTQLRDAQLWVSRDVMMTRRITQTGFPLSLAWDFVEGVPQVEVEYYLDSTVSGGELRREANVRGVESSMVVARNLDTGTTSYTYSPYVFAMTVTASSGQYTDSTTFQVEPRSTAVELIT